MAVRSLTVAFAAWMAVAVGGTSRAETTNELRTVLVVVGAPGTEEFAPEFASWAENWRKVAEVGKAKWLAVGLPKGTNAPASTNLETGASRLSDRDYFKQLLDAEPKAGTGELWLVLVGHGTFNGKEAKFNLIGPDFSAAELSEWLKAFQRPLVLIDCTASSSPFISAMSAVLPAAASGATAAPGPVAGATSRIVISATRSGYEQNFARFGRYLSETIGDPQADLDKDGQTSLLEAYILASKRAAEFYKNENRLATEHALLDDTGDGAGTPADWFRGVRASKKPSQGGAVDGLRAHQLHLLRSEAEQNLPPETRAQRDQIERAINALRDEKAQLREDEYYDRLEKLLLDLAKIYDKSRS